MINLSAEDVLDNLFQSKSPVPKSIRAAREAWASPGTYPYGTGSGADEQRRYLSVSRESNFPHPHPLKKNFLTAGSNFTCFPA
jgi:hypothetical protein